MALDFPSNPVNGQVYDNFIYNSAKGTWKSLSSGASPSVLVNPTITNAVISATATTPSTVPITVNAAASQSANLQEWKSSSGITLASIGSAGDFNLSAPIYSSSKVVGTTEPNGGSSGGLVVKAPASGTQTSGFLQFVNNSYTTQYASIEATTSNNLKLNATYVTTPNQPAFYANGANIYHTMANMGDIPFSVIKFDRGSNFNTSTYRFTAPVAGVYQINTSLFYIAAGNRVSIKVNGATKYDSQTLFDIDWTWSGTLYLAAGDYVTVGDWQNSAGGQVYLGHSSFSGFLVG